MCLFVLFILCVVSGVYVVGVEFVVFVFDVVLVVEYVFLVINVSVLVVVDLIVGYQLCMMSIVGGDDCVLKEILQLVVVVSSSVMQDQQVCLFDDVFGNISGVMQMNMFGGMCDVFIKCGFGLNNDGLVLVDGVCMLVLYSYFVMIDCVEVLKGLVLLLYGMQDLGGVINFVMCKLEDMFGGLIFVLCMSYGGSNVQFDFMGLFGCLGQVVGGMFVFWLIGEYDMSCYWCSFGCECNVLIVFVLLWYDVNMLIDVSYQYVDYMMLFDCGIVFVNGWLDDVLCYCCYEEVWL